MKRLVLAGRGGNQLAREGYADLAVAPNIRLEPGQLPSDSYLAAYLGPRPGEEPLIHWSDHLYPRRAVSQQRRNLSLAEFCGAYDSVELWLEAEPNDQLLLVWLLDYLGRFPELSPKLAFRIIEFDPYSNAETLPLERDIDAFEVSGTEVEIARAAWDAYRAPSPEPAFRLLHRDLTALPFLRRAWIELLEELPSATTGLGATEMRLLELIAAGYTWRNALYHRSKLFQRSVYNEYGVEPLVERLVLAPKPAIAGLDELREAKDGSERQRIFTWMDLSLTDFGKALVAHEEDFSRHNPIDRWWGGTHLTNEKLWRFDPVLQIK